jgi:hypothetical protein
MTTHFHFAEQNCLIFHSYHMLILGGPHMAGRAPPGIGEKVKASNKLGFCVSASTAAARRERPALMSRCCSLLADGAPATPGNTSSWDTLAATKILFLQQQRTFDQR